MKSLVDFATIMSFLVSPFFAILNYRLMNSNKVPKVYRMKKGEKILSFLGISFLILFALKFISIKI